MGPPPSTDEQVVVPSPHHQEEEEEEAKMEIPSLSLDMLLSPASSCDVNQLGPTALAYVGDVVFELFVRTRKVWPSRKMSHLQNQVVALVRGEFLICVCVHVCCRESQPIYMKPANFFLLCLLPAL